MLNQLCQHLNNVADPPNRSGTPPAVFFSGSERQFKGGDVHVRCRAVAAAAARRPHTYNVRSTRDTRTATMCRNVNDMHSTQTRDHETTVG